MAYRDGRRKRVVLYDMKYFLLATKALFLINPQWEIILFIPYSRHVGLQDTTVTSAEWPRTFGMMYFSSIPDCIVYTDILDTKSLNNLYCIHVTQETSSMVVLMDIYVTFLLRLLVKEVLPCRLTVRHNNTCDVRNRDGLFVKSLLHGTLLPLMCVFV